MENRKYGEVKMAILRFMQDGKPHNFDEIRTMIIEKGIKKDFTKQYLATAISQLVANGEKIIKLERGKYCYDLGTEVKESEKTFETEVLNTYKMWINKMNEELTYDLEDEKYAKNKRMVQLFEKSIDELNRICESRVEERH